MATITQDAPATKGFNLQVNIPDPLKRELRSLAGEFDCYPRDLVKEALERYLPMKRQQAKKIREAEATTAIRNRK